MSINFKEKLKVLLDEFERENALKSIKDKTEAYNYLRSLFDEMVSTSQNRQAEIDHGRHLEEIHGIQNRSTLGPNLKR